MEGMEVKSAAYPDNSDYKGRRINWSEIEEADNGYIVKYSEKEKEESNSMEHVGYKDHKKLFSSTESDKAWELYKEVKMAEMKYKKIKKGY